MERNVPLPQEFYRHFKGKLYQVITVASHTETGEELVIYQALYDDYKVYARPLTMFLSEVDKEKYPEATQKYRFEKINLTKKDEQKQEQAETVVEEVSDDSDEEKPNPDLIEFLDADTLEEKRRILLAMKTRITDRLINDIAASLDVTVEDGELDERYRDLLVCVETMERFEVNRLR